MHLTIEKIAQGGRGLARLEDGRVCFVENALPNELVDVQLERSKKDYAEGVATRILQPHPKRANPVCPLYGRCGGCNLQHADFDLQIELYREVVNELFQRFAKTELPEQWPISSGDSLGYRNRARFVWSGRGWGFHERASHYVIPVQHCPVLSDGLNQFLANPPASIRSREVDVFDNGQGQVVWDYAGLRNRQESQTMVSVLGKTLSMDASVFFQSNLAVLPELVNAVVLAAGTGDHAVDLFSGVGLFSLFLQDKFKRVSAVERDAGCLVHARSHLGVNCQFVAEPAEDWLAGPARLDGVDCVVVDPPRTGLPVSVCDAIIKSGTQKLIYVSCDPVTLARDTRILLAGSYQIASAQGFAFYPQTSHFEMMVVFVKTT